MSRKWFLTLMIAAALTIPAFGKDRDRDKDDKSSSSNVEQQLKALDQQMRQAALKGDTSVLEQHLANDYVGIGASGTRMTKDEAIQSRRNGAVKYDAIDVRDQKIRVYGNTAIVEDEANVKGTANGQPINGDYRATFVWVKQGNNWKEVSFQSTPIQSTTSAATKK